MRVGPFSHALTQFFLTKIISISSAQVIDKLSCHFYPAQNLWLHRKYKTSFWEMPPVLGVKPKRGCYLLVWLYFKVGIYVQPHLLKGLGESFPLMWLNIGLCWKISKCALPLLESHTQNRFNLPQNGGFVLTVFVDTFSEVLRKEKASTVNLWGSCHKRQKLQAPTPQVPIRIRQTRKVSNAKVYNRNTNLT